ncbi:MAG: hypothetical protein EOR78_29295 [Mesorhizobium sp.]|nr:MAG: hypothetical protein EOR78_29295 [Mesorhizobium sp.]
MHRRPLEPDINGFAADQCLGDASREPADHRGTEEWSGTQRAIIREFSLAELIDYALKRWEGFTPLLAIALRPSRSRDGGSLRAIIFSTTLVYF